MTTTEQTVTITVERQAAREAAEELYQSAREAADQEQFAWSNRLEAVADKLWRAATEGPDFNAHNPA